MGQKYDFKIRDERLSDFPPIEYVPKVQSINNVPRKHVVLLENVMFIFLCEYKLNFCV